MKILTSKQQNILDFVRYFITERGYPPTVRDIVTGCGISSTSVVSYNLDILCQRGYIRRHPEVSRGIELSNQSPDKDNLLQVPIMGYIAAGKPIPVPTADIWDAPSAADTIMVAEDLTRSRKGIYALKVRGSSMMDALIGDGDIVLMQHVSMVENGEMAAVWLKAEKEVTLKAVYIEPDYIRLQPANSEMKALLVEPDNVEIQGRVIAVIRQVS